MNFRLTKISKKELKKLPLKLQKIIITKILELASISQTNQVKKLENSPYFRLRIGDYRAIFQYSSQTTILIIHIAHRKDAYRSN